MPLICLFEPDGSDKTTLAKVLVRELEDHGFNVRISWMRPLLHNSVNMTTRSCCLKSKLAILLISSTPFYSLDYHASESREIVEYDINGHFIPVATTLIVESSLNPRLNAVCLIKSMSSQSIYNLTLLQYHSDPSISNR